MHFCTSHLNFLIWIPTKISGIFGIWKAPLVDRSTTQRWAKSKTHFNEKETWIWVSPQDPKVCSAGLAYDNMAAIPGFLHFYTSKDYCTISLVQILAAWTAVAVSNYASPSTSLVTRTALSLRMFCMVFSVLCFTLIRIKSRIKLTVRYDSFFLFLVMVV